MLVGTLANDSGSVLLVIGTIYLAVAAGYFWAALQPARLDVDSARLGTIAACASP